MKLRVELKKRENADNPSAYCQQRPAKKDQKDQKGMYPRCTRDYPKPFQVNTNKKHIKNIHNPLRFVKSSVRNFDV